MSGETGQQGSARHLIDALDPLVEAALLADRSTDIRRSGIIAAGRKIEEHAGRSEILDFTRLQVFDGRIFAPVQKRDPVIVRAHMHAALVSADIVGDLGRRRNLRLASEEHTPKLKSLAYLD